MYNNIGGKPNSRIVRKGSWTDEEDNLLRKCIEKYGEGNWHRVPLRAGLNRCRKSCRLRWMNYLKPNIKRGQFNEDEVDLIIRLHKLLGNRWSLIAGRIPGRTANDVKNYWNTHLLKKLTPSTRPPKHPNTIQNIPIKNNNLKETPQKHKSVAPATSTSTSKIIRPQPWTFPRTPSAPSVASRPDSFTDNTTLRNSSEEEEDDDYGANANGNWWENLVEMYDENKDESKECNGPSDCQQPNNHSGGFSIWPTLSHQLPCSNINNDHVEEHNIWEDDHLWNFDASVWE